MAKVIVFEENENRDQEMKVFINNKGEITFEIYDREDDSGYHYQNISLPVTDVELLIKDLRELINNNTF